MNIHTANIPTADVIEIVRESTYRAIDGVGIPTLLIFHPMVFHYLTT